MRINFNFKQTPYEMRLRSPDGYPIRNVSFKLAWPGRILQSNFTNNRSHIWEGPIYSNSMEPGIHHGDGIKFKEVQYLKKIFGKIFNPDLPKYDDIVLFWHPGTEEGFIKRVIALPKDFIEIKNGTVYRNGAILLEPYVVKKFSEENFSQIQAPSNHIFVLGDNRRTSKDSRDFGPVHISRIFGIVQEVIKK